MANDPQGSVLTGQAKVTNKSARVDPSQVMGAMGWPKSEREQDLSSTILKTETHKPLSARGVVFEIVKEAPVDISEFIGTAGSAIVEKTIGALPGIIGDIIALKKDIFYSPNITTTTPAESTPGNQAPVKEDAQVKEANAKFIIGRGKVIEESVSGVRKERGVADFLREAGVDTMPEAQQAAAELPGSRDFADFVENIKNASMAAMIRNGRQWKMIRATQAAAANNPALDPNIKRGAAATETAFEGGSGKSGSGSANFSSTGGGAG